MLAVLLGAMLLRQAAAANGSVTRNSSITSMLCPLFAPLLRTLSNSLSSTLSFIASFFSSRSNLSPQALTSNLSLSPLALFSLAHLEKLVEIACIQVVVWVRLA